MIQAFYRPTIQKLKNKGANDMLWLILKCIFWILLGFILLCELAAIRVSGLCSREEERQEALEKTSSTSKKRALGRAFLRY